MLTELDVSKKIIGFESKYQVYNITYEGISIWQIIRPKFALRMQNLKIESRAISKAELIRASLRGLNIFRLLRQMISRNTIQYLFLSYYSALRVSQESRWSDVYVDKYIENLPQSAKLIRINAPGFQGKVSRSVQKPLYDLSILMVLASILWRIFPDSRLSDKARELSDCISSCFPDVALSEKEIFNSVNEFVWQSRVYCFLLKILKPQVCLVPDTGEQALLFACRKLRVKFVELQHGVFSKSHRCLISKELNVDQGTLLLPDLLAVYGEYWKAEVDNSMMSINDRTAVVGNPILESYRKKRVNIQRHRTKDPMVLVTSGGINSHQINQFVASCASLSPDTRFILKLHPAYGSRDGEFDALKSLPNVQVVSGSESPSVYDLICHTDLHLSGGSACHFDALSIGTPTAIIPVEGYENIMALVERDHALFINDPDDLTNYLRTKLKAPNSLEYCAKWDYAVFEKLTH